MITINGVFTFGSFDLNPDARTLLRDGIEVALGSRAFDMLVALVRRQGEIISRRDLMSFAWNGLNVEESNVRVQMAHLRRELGCGFDGDRYITSVAGRGYCFVKPVKWSEAKVSQSSALTAPNTEMLAPSVKLRAAPAVASDPAKMNSLASIFGREQSLIDLVRSVEERPLVTVVGPGGVGKTTLALMLNNKVTTFDDIHFVDLGSVTENSFVANIVSAAVLPQPVSNDPMHDVLDHLSGGRTLIILDNCEHVIDGVADVVAVLLSVPGTHVLATSIEPLRILGETVFLLKPLGTPPNNGRLTAKRALAWPSVQLFMQRAADGGYWEQFSDAQAASVAAICRRLDGNPLAIELAASRVGVYGLDGVAALLDSQVSLRWRGSRNAIARHQTFEALLEWTFALLSPVAKAVLRRLSVFKGEFSFTDALAIASDEQVDESLVAESLGELIEKSMINSSPSEFGPGCLKLRETVRTYAAMKLAAAGESGVTRLKHADYFLALLQLQATRQVEVNQSTAARRESIIVNIRSALEWAFSDLGNPIRGAYLCHLSTPIFFATSRFDEHARWCKRALRELPDELQNTELHLSILESYAISSHIGGTNDEDAVTTIERGLALSRSLDNKRLELHFLAASELFHLKFGIFDLAHRAAEQYGLQATTMGGDMELAAARWLRGNANHLMGEQGEADTAYKQGFDLSSGVNSSDLRYFENIHRVMAKISQARVTWLKGAPERAFTLAEDAIEEARANPSSLGLSLLIGASIFMFGGELDRAESLNAEMMQLTERGSLAGFRASALALRGQLLVMRGSAEEGIGLLRAKLTVARSVKHQTIIYSTLRALAEGLSMSGEHAEAHSVIDTALGASDRAGGTYLLPELLRTKAQVFLAAPNPNFSAADRVLQEGIQVARRTSAISWELRLRLAQIDLNRLRGRGNPPEAIQALRMVVGSFRDGFDTPDLVSANNHIGFNDDNALAG